MADGVEVNLTGLDSVLGGNWMPSHRSLAINPVVQRCVKRRTSSGTERAIMPRGLMTLSPKRLSTKTLWSASAARRFAEPAIQHFVSGVMGGAGQYANTKANVRKGRAGKSYNTAGDKGNPGGDTSVLAIPRSSAQNMLQRGQ